MVGRTLAPLIGQGSHRPPRTYGTMESDNSAGTEESGSQHEAGKRAGDRSIGRDIRDIIIVFCIFVPFIWILCSLKRQGPVAPLPPPVSQHLSSGQVPRYLWVIEHDRNAHSKSLATLKSLYTMDGLLTKASDDHASIIDIQMWSLDRATYTHLDLDDIFQSPDNYTAVLEADLMYCEAAESVGVPAVRSGHCRVFGNSYFPQSADPLWWPSLEAFDVAVNFSLAFRPEFEGKHRLEPYRCQATDPGMADVTATVYNFTRSLSVVFPKRLAPNLEGSDMGDDKSAPILAWRRAESMVDAVAPGFYVLPHRDFPVDQRNVKRNPTRVKDSIKDGNSLNNTDAPHVTLRPTRFLAWHVVCTLCRIMWARCCRGHFRCHEAAGLPTIMSRAILPTESPVLKHPLSGLWVAIGMLVLFSVMALAGWLVRRGSSQRSVSAAEKPKGRLNVSRPVSLADQTIPEEPEESPPYEIDTRARYLRLWQKTQVALYAVSGWGKGLADWLRQMKSQASDLNQAEEEKTKTTRIEDPTELHGRVTPPASATPAEGANDKSLDKQRRPDDRTSGDWDHGSAEHNRVSSTAQESRSRTAVTRRSNRSSNVQVADAEDL